jgi:hypothetical protein
MRSIEETDALLTAQDLRTVDLPRGAIVLVRTGWSRHWPDRKAYFGDDTPGDTAHLHFPGIAEDAAQLLVARGVAAVGIDTPSIDHGPSADFRAHLLLNADIPAFENLTGLEELPARDFWVIAMPMKIRGGSGGPGRHLRRHTGTAHHGHQRRCDRCATQAHLAQRAASAPKRRSRPRGPRRSQLGPFLSRRPERTAARSRMDSSASASPASATSSCSE